MATICSRHPFEFADNLCSTCGVAYCLDCLVYPKGPNKPPLCLHCALAKGGVRSSARPKPQAGKREIRRSRQQLFREQEQLYLPPAPEPADAEPEVVPLARPLPPDLVLVDDPGLDVPTATAPPPPPPPPPSARPPLPTQTPGDDDLALTERLPRLRQLADVARPPVGAPAPAPTSAPAPAPRRSLAEAAQQQAAAAPPPAEPPPPTRTSLRELAAQAAANGRTPRVFGAPAPAGPAADTARDDGEAERSMLQWVGDLTRPREP